jgi:nucleoside-diphosphate-sugar epimerase
MKHTILGAGGSIGNPLAYELLKDKQDVRLVSRTNFSIEGAESVKADLCSYDETFTAVKNSDVVYMCAGLPYNTKTWTELWPKVMQNTIDACKKANSKLIFFDNVYMYGKVEGQMTEETPYKPCSKKGEIRAKIARNLENEIKNKNITASIARAADLYGPYSMKTGMLHILAIDKLMNGKSAQWMVDAHKAHSFTYTLDCAKSLVLLANREDSFNQVWHLPTFNPAPDGELMIELIAKELGLTPKYSVLKKWMVKMAGFFDKTVGELYEMQYQNEFDYHFDSTKFNTAFNYQPVSYEKGIHETIEYLRTL